MRAAHFDCIRKVQPKQKFDYVTQIVRYTSDSESSFNGISMVRSGGGRMNQDRIYGRIDNSSEDELLSEMSIVVQASSLDLISAS